jgi:hypothetical protein
MGHRLCVATLLATERLALTYDGGLIKLSAAAAGCVAACCACCAADRDRERPNEGCHLVCFSHGRWQEEEEEEE